MINKLNQTKMFFYSQSIEVILRKQNLSRYIESIIVSERSGKKMTPTPKLVQVVTASTVSDGEFDYPCTFTSERYKKGSFLRLIKWEINTRTCQLVVHQAQYLGGVGCDVKHGKKWDNQRLKMLATSSVLSKHFTVLHEPSSGVTDLEYPLLDFAAISKALTPAQKPYQTKETFEKIKRPWVNEDGEGMIAEESRKGEVINE